MSGLTTGPTTPGLQVLAIPGACCLMFFLSFYSQWLFNASPDLHPGPMTTRETVVLNSLIACIWYTYYKACTIDPGRYFPANYDGGKKHDNEPSASKASPNPTGTATATAAGTPRWCKKCRAPKPPRAHHCRYCARCVPKMDHHCPWTGNCVSLQTFPYFVRFLLFTNAGLWALGWHLAQRLLGVWRDRHLPAYLGPTLTQLAALTVLTLCCAAMALVLGILLVTTVKGWVFNTTMIEGWEIERHEAVLERYEGGDDFWGVDGQERGGGRLALPPDHVEFPYDLGLFDNMAQAMGTRNPLLWFFPFAGGPKVDTASPGRGIGWEWEEDGLNSRPGMWPPPDPEKLRRAAARGVPGASAAALRKFNSDLDADGLTGEERKAAFAKRQEADLVRRRAAQMAGKSGIIAELEEFDGLDDVDGYLNGDDDFEEGLDGEPGWTNSDGDRLRDYGVDEEAEDEELIPMADDDDEDVPIAELLRRRKAHGGRAETD